MLSKSFPTLKEFRQEAGLARLTHLVIFHDQPDPRILRALETCGSQEQVILTKISEDLGFLQMEVDEKPLLEQPGLVSWFAGHPTVVANPNDVEEKLKYARRWSGLSDEDVPGIRRFTRS